MPANRMSVCALMVEAKWQCNSTFGSNCRNWSSVSTHPSSQPRNGPVGRLKESGPLGRMPDMIDTRFTTTTDSPESLVGLVGLVDIDAFETMLMFLFDRPVTARIPPEYDAGTAIEVIVHGVDCSIGTVCESPFSVLDVVDACADSADLLGRYPRLGDTDGAGAGTVPPVSAMSESERIAALRHALGKTHLVALIAPGHEADPVGVR